MPQRSGAKSGQGRGNRLSEMTAAYESVLGEAAKTPIAGGAYLGIGAVKVGLSERLLDDTLAPKMRQHPRRSDRRQF